MEKIYVARGIKAIEKIHKIIMYDHLGRAQDGGMWNGRVRVGSAENENLEKLKLESSLGEVIER